MSRNSHTGGRHRKAQVHTTLTAAVVVAAAAAGIVLAPAAHADPQGGVGGGPQDGVTGGGQGGVSQSAPAAPDIPIYYVEPPAPYRGLEYQPIPNYSYEDNTYYYSEPVAPLRVEDLHLPVLVDPTRPYIAPVDRVRFGTLESDRPNWLPKADADRLNNQSAVIEAQVTDFWRSIGVPTDRAQRLAATQVAAGAAGGLTTAVIAGGTAAVVGGIAGCGVGAGVGYVVGMATTAGAAALPMAGGGCLIGLGVGAAAFGIPVALGAGTLGALGAASAATPFGAGDLGESTDIGLQNIDTEAITAQTEQTLEQWSADPVGAMAVDAIENVVEQAPVVTEQARDWVAGQPGGQDVLTQVDAAVGDFVANTIPGVAGDLVGAALGNGINNALGIPVS
ncbi:insoluble domain protein [Skermania sp. ID1734]|uniref:insoluble domain protein n=1 Tax=Skermania sp. ID1734 TaxID=2597516 RepID=UPI00117EA342|nr:insoluble domain protein [Skermania sp. ID1734]TSD94820.1 insoluble domain protein [Skermania sp. ID1734]